MYQIRNFNSASDFNDLSRIWQEIGWISSDKKDEEALRIFIEEGRSLAAEFDGAVEGFAYSVPGKMQYLKEEINIQAITAVTVSRVMRKRGMASRLTAELLAAAAADGCGLSVLGMFDQGFYNKLGFGTGSYEHIVSFDPADLKLDLTPRPPARITPDDWKEAHDCRLNRVKAHGSCTLYPSGITRGEMLWSGSKGFGLGYYDNPGGGLSHYFWCNPDNIDHGPYYIPWLSYSTGEQLLELLALMKTLGDQVHLIRIKEPAGIQLQDLISKPFKGRRVTSKSNFENINRATAYWQIRMVNIERCLKKTHLKGESLCFNLELIDPIEDHISGESNWQTLSGNYVITLGPDSAAEPGFNNSLPILKASTGAFSRMWLGVVPASGLALTDQLSGPAELLTKLDRLLTLPRPGIDWDF